MSHYWNYTYGNQVSDDQGYGFAGMQQRQWTMEREAGSAGGSWRSTGRGQYVQVGRGHVNATSPTSALHVRKHHRLLEGRPSRTPVLSASIRLTTSPMNEAAAIQDLVRARPAPPPIPTNLGEGLRSGPTTMPIPPGPAPPPVLTKLEEGLRPGPTTTPKQPDPGSGKMKMGKIRDLVARLTRHGWDSPRPGPGFVPP
ncbi:hypothetical protein HDV00_008711 [Rhizophlyctis rosea]|nr:hypothetical protein HDV00_008711 [Rhizophlyctis rosea]